ATPNHGLVVLALRLSRRPSLRLALAGVHAVRAEDVADDNRNAAERGKIGRAPADPELHAAVKRVACAELVNGTGIDSHDRRTGRVLAREPERFDIRVPVVRDGRARRHRDEMLHELRLPCAAADATAAVIDADVRVTA